MRNDGESPHHTVCHDVGCGCVCLLIYSWGSAEREVPAQYIDGKVIKAPTVRMLPLAYSVCGICTVLCGNSSCRPD